jgi:hypothetical protein
MKTLVMKYEGNGMRPQGMMEPCTPETLRQKRRRSSTKAIGDLDRLVDSISLPS